MQLDAKDGQLTGYAKPLLRDLDVIDWKKDRSNSSKLAWKVVAASAFGIFKNHDADQFGTRIPIKGVSTTPRSRCYPPLAASCATPSSRRSSPNSKRRTRASASRHPYARAAGNARIGA